MNRARVYRSATSFGRHWSDLLVDWRKLSALKRIPEFFLQWREYRRGLDRPDAVLLDTYPCLNDNQTQTPFDAHYFYQAVWLARNIVELHPAIHVDVGSSVTVVAVLSAVVPTIFVDYRPLAARVKSLMSVGADIVRLPFRSDSLASLSCLHVIEHVGLGRYGDGLDPEGSAKAGCELARVVRAGGTLLVSVPVGRERVCFNAHRVFAPSTVLKMFKHFDLTGFAFVDDRKRWYADAEPTEAATCDYGCGMFKFVKVGKIMAGEESA